MLVEKNLFCWWKKMYSNNNEESARKLHSYEKIPYDLLLLAEETKEAIDKYIKDSEIFVFERKNNIIGIYVLKSIDEQNIEIKYIAVDEKFQGQGIGTFLLNDATIRAREKGLKTIIIGTGDCGIKQLQLYQKVGFEIFDVKKNFFIDNYPEPIFENGKQCRDMVMLKKQL